MEQNPTPAPTADEADVTVVVDTNVLLDVYSCHDLTETYERVGETGVASSLAVYRRARVRESLLLAMLFHSTGATTLSLEGEPRSRLLDLVPPANHGSFATHFTIIFLDFVRPRLLPRWKPAQHPAAANERGTDADRWLVEYARSKGLPLVTNEGYSAVGVKSAGLRKRAEKAGVTVFTPSEFWRDKLNESEEIAQFLKRFAEFAPAYVAGHAKRDVIAESVEYAEGYYRHVRKCSRYPVLTAS